MQVMQQDLMTQQTLDQEGLMDLMMTMGIEHRIRDLENMEKEDMEFEDATMGDMEFEDPTMGDMGMEDATMGDMGMGGATMDTLPLLIQALMRSMAFGGMGGATMGDMGMGDATMGMGGMISNSMEDEEVQEAVGEEDDKDLKLVRVMIEEERKKHEAPLLDKKYAEAINSGMSKEQIEQELLKLVKMLNPGVTKEMALTGEDKKTVLRTVIGQKYLELEDTVGITWESMAATVEEAVAAVQAEAAVGEEQDDSAKNLLLIHEMIEEEKKEHTHPLLDTHVHNPVVLGLALLGFGAIMYGFLQTLKNAWL